MNKLSRRPVFCEEGRFPCALQKGVFCTDRAFAALARCDEHENIVGFVWLCRWHSQQSLPPREESRP